MLVLRPGKNKKEWKMIAKQSIYKILGHNLKSEDIDITLFLTFVIKGLWLGTMGTSSARHAFEVT